MPKNVEGVKADPPAIFYSTTPALLVNLDGEAVWSPIEKNDLRFAVNTNWDLFEHKPSNTFYLRHGNSWLSAPAINGPWKAAGKLPGSFTSLPADANWNEVKAALPGQPLATPPKVFVSSTPAEMILLTGAPNYLAVTGTQLLWVSNTEADVFKLGKDGPVYYLVSGRWFSAPGFTGPWTFATPTLPEDFKKIPLSHKRSRVLASVPGTDAAVEAVLLAQIPQTARVDKKQVKAPEVQFQGEPQFQAIEQTTVSRAVNTDKDIIKVGDLYYMFVNAMRTLREHCIEGITANPDVCLHNVNYSIGTVTALNPVIGYERASELAAEAARTGRGILELVREKAILSEKQLGEVLDPMTMTGQEHPA